MKVIFFSDLHAHAWSEFSNNVDGLPDRLVDCVSVIDAVTSYAVAHRIKHIVFGGDMTHVPGTLKTMVLQLLTAALHRAKKAGLKVYADPGNHDYQDRAGSYNTIRILQECGLLISSSNLLDLSGVELALLPYTDSEDEFKRRIEKFPARKLIAVFHHGFKGARTGSDLEYIVKNPISCAVLPKEWIAFSGHYHTHQRVDNRLTYIGSPLEHTRSDRNKERKGFIVYDTNKNSIKTVPLKSPQFIELSELELLGPMSGAAGNFVDMTVCDVDPAEASEQIMAAGARGCYVSMRATPKTARKTVSKTRGSDRDILLAYINERKADKHLLDVGLSLLAEESV